MEVKRLFYGGKRVERNDDPPTPKGEGWRLAAVVPSRKEDGKVTAYDLFYARGEPGLTQNVSDGATGIKL